MTLLKIITPRITKFTTGIGVDITLYGLKKMSEKMVELTHLDVSSNIRISNMEGFELIESFKKLKTLKVANVFTMRSGSIDEERTQVSYILECLLSLKELTEIDFSGNAMRDSELEIIAKMTGLRKLNVSENGIGNVGVKHISQLKELRVLDISYNHVGDEGLECICDCMPQLTSLNLLANKDITSHETCQS